MNYLLPLLQAELRRVLDMLQPVRQGCDPHWLSTTESNIAHAPAAAAAPGPLT
jgi:hypothetical protein